MPGKGSAMAAEVLRRIREWLFGRNDDEEVSSQ
jgi:hypothetical protein